MSVEHVEEFSTRENNRRSKTIEARAESTSESKGSLEIRELKDRCSELDRDLIKIIEHARGLEVAIKKGKTLETLAFGKELSVKPLDKTGVNSITRNEYQGDPPRTAFVKPQSGEARFLFDSETKQSYRVWKQKKSDGTFEEVRSALPPVYTSGIKRVQEELAPKFVTDIARHYGVVPQEVTLYDKGFSGQLGIEAGGSVQREYFVSRVNELLQWDVVPVTVLRSDNENSDISSVQEGVKGSKDGKAPRSLDVDLYKDLLQKGDKHPAGTSFMRLACLDYLVKSTDRHPENLLYDAEAEVFYGIDNGRCLSLSGKPEGKKSKTLDKNVSVPLSVVQEHPSWRLDEEAHQQAKNLYENVLKYLNYKDQLEKKESSVDKPSGVEAKYLSQLFRVVFKNQKIASREAIEFILRLKHIAEHGRPPYLEPNVELADLANFYPTLNTTKKN